jgi:hypothetical protein
MLRAGLRSIGVTEALPVVSKTVAELRRRQQAGNAATNDHDSYNLSHENIQRVMN